MSSRAGSRARTKGRGAGRISKRGAALAIGAALAVGSLMSAAPFGVSAAHAGSWGFLCPTSGRLISVGQGANEVRKKCREPDDVQQRVELRTIRETQRRWVQGVVQEFTVERTVEVQIEEWSYDFGPGRFTKLLHFEQGRLVLVEEGAKGTVGGG